MRPHAVGDGPAGQETGPGHRQRPQAVHETLLEVLGYCRGGALAREQHAGGDEALAPGS